MNRILLIGNGFDLAHGIPTSYQDFLNDYWRVTTDSIKNSSSRANYENEELKISLVPNTWPEKVNFLSFKDCIESWGGTIEFKNLFLRIITTKSSLKNWVDIENEYYLLLIELLNNKNIRLPKNYEISHLNKDFERVKILLTNYLERKEKEFLNPDEKKKKSDEKIKSAIIQKIYTPMDLGDLSLIGTNIVLDNEFIKVENILNKLKNGSIIINDIPPHVSKILHHFEKGISKEKFKEIPFSVESPSYFNDCIDKTLFLSFNYTSTSNLYYNYHPSMPIQSIPIHGSLNKKTVNPVIFGYGNETDENYKNIEGLNDNEYLENIKSIKYSETSSYKKLLEFIESDSYQIFILGHSCGASDRTLLNTLFEHANCISIKPFYHQINDTKDNYRDIVQNISRNFDDKAKMRDRLVIKPDCEPLT